MSDKPLVFLGDKWPPDNLDATTPAYATIPDPQEEANEFAKLLEVLNATDDPNDAGTVVEALTLDEFKALTTPAAPRVTDMPDEETLPRTPTPNAD